VGVGGENPVVGLYESLMGIYERGGLVGISITVGFIMFVGAVCWLLERDK